MTARGHWAVIAAVFVMGPMPSGAQARGDDPGGAAQYFMQMRAFPAARIPPRARQIAMAQMRARWPRTFIQRDVLATTVPNPSSTTTWTPIGPSPLTGPGGAASGRLNSIAIDPTNSQIIYVAGAQGGVWKTVDGGGSWVPLTDSQCSLAMGAIAIDPKDPTIIYAGTGEQNNSGDSYYGCGVLRSTDGGSHWTQLGASVFDSPTGGATISRIVVDQVTAGSAASTVVYAATSLGLYRSPDSGTTWILDLSDPVTGLSTVSTDVVQDPTTPATLYAAQGRVGGSSANGVFKTVNGGSTWTRISTFLPATNVGRISLAISPQPQTTVYVAVEDANNGTPGDGSLLGLWVTTDGGATWTQRLASPPANNPLCGSGQQCWYDMVMAADPTNASTLYFGGFSLYKSIDGGATFTDIGLSIHVDQHALAFDPQSPATVFCGNDGGIFKTSNGGTTWTNLNTNLALTQFYAGVSVSPISATTILGGTQDNGTLQWVGTANWLTVVGGDGGFTALDQLTGGTAFAETQWTAGTGPGPRRRDPPGSSFVVKNLGISISDRAMFIPPLVMDPVRSRVVYFGTLNLYRSANSGDLWTNIGSSLVASTGSINAIGVATSDSLTLYVGSSDGRVSFTHDLGTTWTAATGLPLLAVTDIAVDSRDSRTAIVVFGGFSRTTSSHVFRTTDGGVTWTNISFDLPDIPTLAVVLEPGSGDIDIGTDLGVFTLRNGASSWTPIVNGLPNVAVYDLVFDSQRSRLIAATHGRGMFYLDVTPGPVLRGDVTGPNGVPDGSVGALDAQAILAMVVGLPIPAGSIRFPNADANCDGQVTALDALVVLMKAASINTGTCVGTIR